jgi:hypothetical protein
MPVVDVHAHLGDDQIFEHEFTRDQLLHGQAENGVAATIVQPASVADLATVRAQHDAIAALAAELPGQFFGMAAPNPRLPEADYFAEVRRCVRELRFVGAAAVADVVRGLVAVVQPATRSSSRAGSRTARSGAHGPCGLIDSPPARLWHARASQGSVPWWDKADRLSGLEGVSGSPAWRRNRRGRRIPESSDPAHPFLVLVSRMKVAI